ncbi:hypothetical protein ACFV5J_19550 [Streptomyces zaomyceticus]|uniref:hypothetical protein n=1 Tax=Streptomyces zaomyceticus TaxID=68286 RepID=UPI00364661AA
MRVLVETFHNSKALWSEYRNGAKLIPEQLLNNVVDKFVPDAEMRERQRAEGRRLLEAARAAARRLAARGPQASLSLPDRPSMPAGVGEVLLRLDDARLQQIEAMRRLADSEKRCSQLQEMVSALQNQCARLTEERDHARLGVTDAHELHAALEQSEIYRTQAEGQLRRARKATEQAFELRLAAEANLSRAQADARRTTGAAHGTGSLPQPVGVGMDLPPLERIGEVLRAVQDQLVEQDEELDELRSHLGVAEPLVEDAAAPHVITGKPVARHDDPPANHGIVHEAPQDNMNSPVTSTDTASGGPAVLVPDVTTASSPVAPREPERQRKTEQKRAAGKAAGAAQHGKENEGTRAHWSVLFISRADQVTDIEGLVWLLHQLRSKTQVSPEDVARNVFGAARHEHVTTVGEWLSGPAVPTDRHFTLLVRALNAGPDEVTALQRARNRVLFNARNERAPSAPRPVQQAPLAPTPSPDEPGRTAQTPPELATQPGQPAAATPPAPPTQTSPENVITPRTCDADMAGQPTAITIALSRVSTARQLGKQIEALRRRADVGGEDWSHARLASEVSQGFATRKARRVVRKWLAGKVVPSWPRLRPLLTAMDADDTELTAFQEALKRVSRTTTVMADPAEISRRSRRRSERIWITTLTCLTVLTSAAATGIVLSATYTADPFQPLWKPLTAILASAALAVGARTVLYLVYDSWIPVLVFFGWLLTLLTGYALPLLTDDDYGGRAMAAAIGFL